MHSEGDEDSDNSFTLPKDLDNEYLTMNLNDKRRLQKQKSINLRFNYPFHYTHKDRKILRRIVNIFPPQLPYPYRKHSTDLAKSK